MPYWTVHEPPHHFRDFVYLSACESFLKLEILSAKVFGLLPTQVLYEPTTYSVSMNL